MVKRDLFKTCSQSGFCKRNRDYADSAFAKGSSWSAPYQLESRSIQLKDGQLEGIVIKTTHDNEKVRLPLIVSFLDSGVARVTLDEEKRLAGDIELRHDSKARKERYNESAKWTLVGGLDPSLSAALVSEVETGITKVLYGPEQRFQAIIRHEPFEVLFQRDGETHVQFNDRGLLNMEHWRAKKEPPPPAKGEESPSENGVDESTWWDEPFGGNTDSKPKGPESVGLDITFPGYEHVFGIPEHADSMSLRETR